MKSITFTVYGDPVPQPRQRYRVVVPKVGKPFATNYTPANDPVNLWKTQIQWAVQPMKPPAPFAGPVLMDVEFYLHRPDYMMAAKFSPGRVYHYSRGDLDNLFKAVADALNKICYNDDGQICDQRTTKFYTEKSGKARAVILIQELT